MNYDLPASDAIVTQAGDEMTSRRSSFRQVLKERSGRYRARYTAPGAPQRWVNAPATFETKCAAQLWLARERTTLEDRRLEVAAAARDGREPIQEPAEPVPFGEYGREWLQRRRLKESTRTLYTRQFAKALEPGCGAIMLTDITPQRVSAWHSTLLPGRPTERAHVYSHFRTILQTSWRESLIPANPRRVEGGASSGRRAHAIRPASLVELELLTSALPTRLQPMALLGAWCAMRFGEVTALRREDLDLEAGVIRVRRGVTWLTGVPIIDSPKTAAGTRDVAVPPHLLPILRQHLDAEVGRRPGALLFPLEPNSDIPYRHTDSGPPLSRRESRPADRISPSTRCGTPEPCLRRLRTQRSPSSWPASVIRHQPWHALQTRRRGSRPGHRSGAQPACERSSLTPALALGPTADVRRASVAGYRSSLPSVASRVNRW